MAKARRAAGRALLLGLASSVAPTRVGPASVLMTSTVNAAANTASISSEGAGGDQTGAASVATPPDEAEAGPDAAPLAERRSVATSTSMRPCDTCGSAK